MTPEELQELRDWAARKMGWDLCFEVGIEGHYCTCDDDSTFCKEKYPRKNWQPDRPETGQIWMLVERMLKLGWDFHIDNYVDDDEGFGASFQKEDVYDPTIVELKKQGAEEIAKNLAQLKAFQKLRTFTDPNPCLAILKAAKATED